MDLFGIEIILVIDCIGLKHNGCSRDCSMLISHGVCAEMTLAAVYYAALQSYCRQAWAG